MNDLSAEVGRLEAQLRDLRKRNSESRKDVDEAAKHANSTDAITRAKQVIAEREREIERLERGCKDLRSELRKYVSSRAGGEERKRANSRPREIRKKDPSMLLPVTPVKALHRSSHGAGEQAKQRQSTWQANMA